MAQYKILHIWVRVVQTSDLYITKHGSTWYNRDGACPAPSIPYISISLSVSMRIHIFHHHRVAMSEIHVCL